MKVASVNARHFDPQQMGIVMHQQLSQKLLIRSTNFMKALYFSLSVLAAYSESTVSKIFASTH